MGYKILGHTADVRLKVWGASLEEVFRDALEGMMEIIKLQIAQRESQIENKIQIKIESMDRTALLIDFLSEALYQTQTRKQIFTNVDFKTLTDTKLEAELSGVKVNKFDEDIKAVTYHEVEIKENEKGELETIIVFDI